MDAPVEIERRYIVDPTRLVNQSTWPVGAGGVLIRQGYLHNKPSLRVRVAENRGYLTLKGKGVVKRVECEMEIPVDMASELLAACPRVLYKTRYTMTHEGRTWVVDSYSGPLRGLWTAEVELDSEDAVVVAPEWAIKEVTDDKRYSAASLTESQTIPPNYLAAILPRLGITS